MDSAKARSVDTASEWLEKLGPFAETVRVELGRLTPETFHKVPGEIDASGKVFKNNVGEKYQILLKEMNLGSGVKLIASTMEWLADE